MQVEEHIVLRSMKVILFATFSQFAYVSQITLILKAENSNNPQ